MGRSFFDCRHNLPAAFLAAAFLTAALLTVAFLTVAFLLDAQKISEIQQKPTRI